MLGSIGMPEMLFILVLALLVFGPKRLPQVGRTVGKGLREFRRATSDLKRSVEVGMHEDEAASPRPTPVAPAMEAREADVEAEEPADAAEPSEDSGQPAVAESTAESGKTD